MSNFDLLENSGLECIKKIAKDYAYIEISDEFIKEHIDGFVEAFSDEDYSFISEANSNGLYDTSPRDRFIDCLSYIVTNKAWPANYQTKEEIEDFKREYLEKAAELNNATLKLS